MSSRFIQVFILTQLAFDALVAVYAWSNHLWRDEVTETVTFLLGQGNI